MQIPIILIQGKAFGFIHSKQTTTDNPTHQLCTELLPSSSVGAGKGELWISLIEALQDPSALKHYQEPSSCASLPSTSSSGPMETVPNTLFPTRTSEQRRKTPVEHTALFIIPLMCSRAAPELARKQIPSQQLECSCAFCKLHIQPCRLKVPTQISLSYQCNHQLFLGFYFSKENAMPGKGVGLTALQE